MKLETLSHPLQAVTAAKASLSRRLRMWEFANHGRRHFRGDTRYDLQNGMDSSLESLTPR